MNQIATIATSFTRPFLVLATRKRAAIRFGGEAGLED
jgi:hypothetical protein